MAKSSKPYKTFRQTIFLNIVLSYLKVTFQSIRISPNVEIEISCCFDEEIFTTTNVTVTDELTNPGGVDGSGRVVSFALIFNFTFTLSEGIRGKIMIGKFKMMKNNSKSLENRKYRTINVALYKIPTVLKFVTTL